MDQPTILTVGDGDENRAIYSLTLAFSADPTMRWFYPEPDVYYEAFPELLRAYAGRAFEHAAAYATADFSGSALWLPPDVSPDEEPVGELVDRTIRPEVREEVYALFAEMDEYHPHDEPTWYRP